MNALAGAVERGVFEKYEERGKIIYTDTVSGKETVSVIYQDMKYIIVYTGIMYIA